MFQFNSQTEKQTKSLKKKREKNVVQSNNKSTKNAINKLLCALEKFNWKSYSEEKRKKEKKMNKKGTTTLHGNLMYLRIIMLLILKFHPEATPGKDLFHYILKCVATIESGKRYQIAQKARMLY